MIRINLLPVRQTRKLEGARIELSLAMVGGLMVVLLAGATWGFFTYQLAATRDQNSALQAEIDRLAADVAKVDEMEKFKAELERKLAVIQDLRDRKAGPVHMLDELTSAAPEKLYLTRVQELSGEVSVTGVSVSNDVISQFLRSLDDSPYFEQVYLQDIEAMSPEKNLSITLKSFKLTARLVTPSTAAKGAATQGAGAAGVPVPAGTVVPAPPAAPEAPAPSVPAPEAPAPSALPPVEPAASPAPTTAPATTPGGGA
ncbi:MAG: PilN domain-containing protein [Pseudomonadota bacterium]|nr:PilN domain-containing protein [Pseudomonadota bacterium]